MATDHHSGALHPPSSAAKPPLLNQWREILGNDTLPQPEKHRRLVESGLTGSSARSILLPTIQQELRMTEEELQQRRSELKNHQSLVRSLDLYRDWEYEETTKFVLERNENTRVHRLQEAAESGLIFDAEHEEFREPRSASPMFSGAKVFVVKHDWAAAFEHSDMEGAEFHLPFEMCIFEFRVTGRTVIVFAWESDKVVDKPRGHTVLLEGVDGLWLTFSGKEVAELSEFLWKHIRAICIALDAQVAERTLVRAPHALNEKRAKNGKPPLRDFHVVDLSRRLRADKRGESVETGRKVRLHFRRGHWRHFETHKTWINWMLVGNPDLGFIDKHYKI